MDFLGVEAAPTAVASAPVRDFLRALFWAASCAAATAARPATDCLRDVCSGGVEPTLLGRWVEPPPSVTDCRRERGAAFRIVSATGLASAAEVPDGRWDFFPSFWVPPVARKDDRRDSRMAGLLRVVEAALAVPRPTAPTACPLDLPPGGFAAFAATPMLACERPPNLPGFFPGGSRVVVRSSAGPECLRERSPNLPDFVLGGSTGVVRLLDVSDCLRERSPNLPDFVPRGCIVVVCSSAAADGRCDLTPRL